MRTKYVIGCAGLLMLISGIICVGGAIRLLRVPEVEIPPRKYPPNNAYEGYRILCARMHRDLKADRRFTEVEQRLFDTSAASPVSAADRAYYMKRMAPYLQEYKQYLDRPCVAVFEYDINWPFPELAQLRRLARAESLHIEEALRRGRAAAAVQRVRSLTRLTEQIRNDGTLIHHLVGIAINAIATAPLRKALPDLKDPDVLRAIVQVARDYEKHREPMLRAIQHEYYMGLSAYRDLATGRLSYEEIAMSNRDKATSSLSSKPVANRIMVNTALPEYHRLMKGIIEEYKKPSWKRSCAEPKPRHPLNAILLPVFSQAGLKEAQELATMRLLGCAAAIKLFKQRTGRYPATLEELQLGSMIIDPYSGKPFIYRTDAAKGFLLYSVSKNRVDDGGWAPYGGGSTSNGDLTPVMQRLPESLRQKSSAQRPLAPPIWLR